MKQMIPRNGWLIRGLCLWGMLCSLGFCDFAISSLLFGGVLFAQDVPAGFSPRQIDKLSAIPEEKGVAGPFAGVLDGWLVVAGGANFPQLPPWEGGTKVWHDRIWMLKEPTRRWHEVGKLPRPLAYGVSITTDEGLICIGGSDDKQHYADVFRLRWEKEKLHIETLPPLPQPVANACGAKAGNVIYVAGGLESPTATKTLGTFFKLDLSRLPLAWEELPTWSARPRMLAVAAVVKDDFYLFSGADLTADEAGKPVREYLKDAWRYSAEKGWSPLPGMPRAAVAAASPALIGPDSQIHILGGDDGKKVSFQPLAKHPGFPRDVLTLRVEKMGWDANQQHSFPNWCVTLPTVFWRGSWILPSGEIRPGVRSPEVWRISF